jgi:hypothetical protein
VPHDRCNSDLGRQQRSYAQTMDPQQLTAAWMTTCCSRKAPTARQAAGTLAPAKTLLPGWRRCDGRTPSAPAPQLVVPSRQAGLHGHPHTGCPDACYKKVVCTAGLLTAPSSIPWGVLETQHCLKP